MNTAAQLYDIRETWKLVEEILESGDLWTPIYDRINEYGEISAEELEKLCRDDLFVYIRTVTDIDPIDWYFVAEEINMEAGV